MSETLVRRAVASDALDIIEIHGECIQQLREVYTPNRARLARRGRREREPGPEVQLVVVREGRCRGSIRCERVAERVHLRSLQVHPDWQGRGLARTLMEGAADHAKRAGARCLSLDTIRQTGNVELFERLGYSIVRATRTDLFDLTGDGCAVNVYMERTLEDAGAPAG